MFIAARRKSDFELDVLPSGAPLRSRGDSLSLAGKRHRYCDELIVERRLTEPWLQGLLIGGNDETFNRLASDESLHNLGDVCSRNAPVEKVIGFD
jgi:hypothetical protein